MGSEVLDGGKIRWSIIALSGYAIDRKRMWGYCCLYEHLVLLFQGNHVSSVDQQWFRPSGSAERLAIKI